MSRDERLPLPAAVVALSPWTDLALTGDSLRPHARSDPMMDTENVATLAAYYLAGADPRTHEVAVDLGDLGRRLYGIIGEDDRGFEFRLGQYF